MAQIPHGLSMVLGALPLLGMAVLLLIVAALATDRDRWIVPGTVAALLLVSGLSAAMEYGPQVQSMIASRAKPAVAVTEPAPGEPASAEPAAEPAETPGATAPAEPPPANNEEPQPASPSPPVPVGYTPGDLVSVPANGQQPAAVIDRTTGRRTMVVNPNAVQPVPPGQPATTPAPAPIPTPVVPTPAPQPTVLQPVPAQPAPRPTITAPMPTPARPTTLAQNRAPELPSLPMPSQPGASSAGAGTLVVKINGPLVETSQTASSGAHVMVILDGKEAHARGPTRTSENRKDNDPSQPLLATTYFWENITFTFSNVDAGWHVLMVDSSLDSQGAHRSAMTGSAQDKNDWNGSVEVKAGQTTTVEFGAKNWMNGQLARVR